MCLMKWLLKLCVSGAVMLAGKQDTVKNCRSQRLTSKYQKTTTAVSASTNGVWEAAVALGRCSGESSSRLSGSEAPDQPRNEVYQSTRHKGRTSRRNSDLDIMPMQWRATELTNWQQRDANILTILITIKLKRLRSTAEIDKLSDTSKCLLVDIECLVLMNNVLCRIWYIYRGEEENYQLVTPHQIRQHLC